MLQATDTAGEELILAGTGATAARHDAPTVAETEIDALAVAACAHSMVQAFARRLNVNTRKIVLTGNPTSYPEGIMVFLSSAAFKESLEIPVDKGPLIQTARQVRSFQPKD